jgi:hypothetical protein
LLLGWLLATARAAQPLSASEGHINFFKHTSPPDDAYTANPTSSTIQFMNSHWPRLMTFNGYWDSGNKLSWYPNAWAYDDSYAIYADPANTYWAQIVQQHPNWILKDAYGNNLYINYACSNGTCTQYAANITDPNGFRAWWISQAQTFFNRPYPYKGLWIDDVNLDLSRVSDGFGNPTVPIDPYTGQPMTNSAWRSYFADFMQQVRSALPGVEIVHNALWFLDITDPNIQREVRAADWINLERGVNDTGLTGGTGYWSVSRFLSTVDAIHALGPGVVFDGEAPLSDSDVAREYSTASYLLTSNGMDLVGDSSQMPTYWWAGFNIDLGKAQGARYTWQALWRRDFASGIALVNPPGASQVTVALPGSFLRPDGSLVNTVSLGPSQGAILVAPVTGPPQPPSGLRVTAR